MVLRRYISEVQPNANANAVYGDVASAGAGAKALQHGADQLGAIEGRNAALAAHQAAAVETGKGMADARESWTRQLLEAQDAAPAGADGFTKQILDGFDKDSAARLTAASDGAKPQLQERLSALRGQISDKALGFELHSRMEKRVNDIGGMVDQQVNATRTDESQFSGAIDETMQAIENAGLRADVKDRVLRDARNRIAQATLQGINENDPARGKQLLDGGSFDDYLHGGAKNALVNDNQVELRRRDAEAERQRREQLQVLQSRVERRFQDDVASRYNEGKGIGVTEGEIRQAFGDDPERIKLMLDGQKRAVDTYNAVQQTALTSPAEDRAILARHAPQGEGYRAELGDYNAVVSAINAKNKAIADDPAGYVMRASPLIREAIGSAQQSPEHWRDVLPLMDKAQATLGIAPEDRQLLGKSQAAAVVGNLLAQPPEKLANGIEQLRQQYGDQYWPGIMRELVAAKLPAPIELLAVMDRPQDAALRVAYGEALKVGPKVLRDNLDKGDAMATEKAVHSALEDFGRTVRAGGGNDRVVNMVQNGVEALAFYYAGRGMSSSDAARTAADQVINGRYDFGRTYRTPKGALAHAEQLTAATLDGLKPADLPVYTGSDPALNDADRRDRALSFARRGFWVTNESDDGLVLLYPDKRPVTRADGRRVEIKFSDELKSGRVAPSPAGFATP